MLFACTYSLMHAAMAAVVLAWSNRETSGLSPVKVLDGKQLNCVSSRPSSELIHSGCGCRIRQALTQLAHGICIDESGKRLLLPWQL